jgi:homoserine dehydrogenase
VMNGTCNYILTRMQATGQGYNALFDECARLGYLEADPQLDVGGIDAGHKLSLLASVAFGTRVNFDAVELEGIERITNEDIAHAADMGYKIKLLGVTQLTGLGLEQRMTPCLVPDTSPLGQLDGGTNMVVLEGDEVGQIVLRGAGAGMGPTASAVMSDIMDIARGTRITTFGQPASTLIDATPAVATAPAPYYLRLALVDKPGSLAKITSALGDAGVSIDRMRQYGQDDNADVAPVLIVTDPTARSGLNAAIETMRSTGVLVSEPVAIRIEQV